MCERNFAGKPTSVKQVRHWAAHVLFKAGVSAEVIGAAEQVLSELCTNCLLHTASGAEGGRFTVRVRRGLSRVRLEVADQGGPSVPRPRREFDPLAESGNGLLLVGLFARDLWVRGGEHGRTVFAELDAGALFPPTPTAKEQ